MVQKVCHPKPLVSKTDTAALGATVDLTEHCGKYHLSEQLANFWATVISAVRVGGALEKEPSRKRESYCYLWIRNRYCLHPNVWSDILLQMAKISSDIALPKNLFSPTLGSDKERESGVRADTPWCWSTEQFCSDPQKYFPVSFHQTAASLEVKYFVRGPPLIG